MSSLWSFVDAVLSSPSAVKADEPAATTEQSKQSTKRSAGAAEALRGLEPKKKKRKSKSKQSHTPIATQLQQQQQQQQEAGSTNTAASPWYTQDEACMRDVFRFIGDGHYLVLATVCRAWCAAYRADGPCTSDRRPGIAQVEQSRSTYYQLLLHSDKFLQALWHPSMVTRDWAKSHDGR
jgi:hypothetical protein